MSFLKKRKTVVVVGVCLAVLLSITFFCVDNLDNNVQNETAIQTPFTISKDSSADLETKETEEPIQKNEQTKVTQTTEAKKIEESASTFIPCETEIISEATPEMPPLAKVTKENSVDSLGATDEYSCTLSVSCKTVLGKNSTMSEVIPPEGAIFPAKKVTFYEGESVFNVLMREMKKNKIHLEFVNTPIYDSVYIEGIGNIYEYDFGELSGWMYKVNDWFPNYGCSHYFLQNGDMVEWVYTCDLGKDVGGDYAEKNGMKN